MPGTNFKSYGKKTGITNAYVVADRIAISSHADDADAVLVPYRADFYSVELAYESRAGGATTLTFFFSRDTAGDLPVTQEVSVTAVGALTTAAKGGNATSFENFSWEHDARDSTAGTIYMHAKWNAGTGDVIVRLKGKRGGLA